MTNGEKSAKKQPPSVSDISVSVENIGGIRESEVTFTPGVNVLAGTNATNRTSLLRAISAALGGKAGVLRRGSDSGSVTLVLDGEEYTRQYERTANTVRTSGDPYTTEETIIDLFVCLLEDNPIRHAVRAGKNLTDLLLAPVDTDELEAQISSLQSERDRIDERLNEMDRERKRLPKLEERRTSLEQEMLDVETELKELRTRTEDANEATESEEIESVRKSFEETQTQLEHTESELETQRQIREELKTELEDVREKLDQQDIREQKIGDLEQKIERLQGRESELSATINEMSTILKQNQTVLAGDDTVITELAVTEDMLDELDPQSQSIECWTCGSRVQRQAISEQLDDIEQLVDQKRTEREEVREKLTSYQAKRDARQQELDRYETLTDREIELEHELERRTQSIEELVSEADALRDELADKQATLETLEDDTDDEQFGIYERMSELEYERGQLEEQLREVEDEINEVEYQLGKYDDLEARRGDITQQLQELRSRVEDIERDTVETFNDHMESVLDCLGYENIERIWLERRTEGNDTMFDLHVVREDDAGMVYEDSVDHLSESEREVVGLVVSLTGYLTHDIRQMVPLLLLDSLEAIDAERIADLVEYIQSHTEFLILALLDEDAGQLPDSYRRLQAVEQLS